MPNLATTSIRRKLEVLGMSTAHLARIFNLTPRCIQHWVAGTRRPSQLNAYRLHLLCTFADRVADEVVKCLAEDERQRHRNTRHVYTNGAADNTANATQRKIYRPAQP